MRPSRLLAGGAAVALLTGTAACGAEALEPKLALRDAAGAFAESRTGGLELSIASSVEDVRAFAAAADPTASSAGMTDDELRRLLSASLEFSYDLGADRESETDDAGSVVVRIGDLAAGELRVVEQMVYARADVDGLVEEFPDLQEGIDSFRAELAGAEGTEPAPPELQAPATAFLDGDWVSLDVEAYLEQLEAMAGGQDAAVGSTGPAPASDELRDLLGGALEDAVTSVERRESDEIGDHVVAQIDLRAAYASLREELPGLLAGTDAEVMADSMPPVSEVPDRRIEVSFWLRDGELRRVELDLAQFLEEPAGSLVLRADVLPERRISAPDDAVELDFAALVAAAPAGGEPLEVDAHTLATWVDADLWSVADQDGGLPSVQYLPEVLPYYEGLAPDLSVTAVGERVQVSAGGGTVCLTVSADGSGEDVTDGPC
ncbi:hypothetical protein [Blastococcus xanthinilyticus]|uniref:Lipoprotein n=1 Tax=Blastococcus xanthinilyticus TaxID=1564164 RepID=A0A5S5D3P3_9ACTN|nr:hypothetical protein [Blastococcus xanthinilyticus]TYP90345.1 hypothetical protein BD833_10163 [Blastococcus xanthinilyticus]